MVEPMNWLRNFMMGRYGPDSFSLFLIVISLVCTLVSSLFGGLWPLLFISYALWFWVIFRMLSRNIEGRAKENEKFMVFWNWMKEHTVGIRGWLTTQANRFRDRRTHKYFRCPKCRQMVRVPKNKGKVRIICPKCKNEFIRQTGKSAAQRAREEQARAEKSAARAAKKADKAGKK